MNKTLINPLNLLHEIIPVFTSVHCARPGLNNKRSRRGKIHFYHTYGGEFCCEALHSRLDWRCWTPGGPRGSRSGGHVGQQLPLKVDTAVKAKDQPRDAFLSMKVM